MGDVQKRKYTDTYPTPLVAADRPSIWEMCCTCGLMHSRRRGCGRCACTGRGRAGGRAGRGGVVGIQLCGAGCRGRPWRACVLHGAGGGSPCTLSTCSSGAGAGRCWRPCTLCRCSSRAGAGRGRHPRTPSTGSSGACAGRGRRLRTPCTGSSSAGAGRCRSLRTPYTGSSGTHSFPCSWDASRFRLPPLPPCPSCAPAATALWCRHSRVHW